jgi:hypothetical protein
MTSYLPAAEATMSLLQKLHKQDIHQAVASPISLRFTASTPANLSMSYSVDPSQSLGRCYIEMPSLFYFYKSIQTYEDISRPHSEESINLFQVLNSFDLLSVSISRLFPLFRVAYIGANTLPPHSQHSSTNLKTLISMQVLPLSELLPRSLILGI